MRYSYGSMSVFWRYNAESQADWQHPVLGTLGLAIEKLRQKFLKASEEPLLYCYTKTFNPTLALRKASLYE